MPPILVTGATGQIGREVVTQLRAAGHRVRALTRDRIPVDVKAVEVTAPGAAGKSPSR